MPSHQQLAAHTKARRAPRQYATMGKGGMDYKGQKLSEQIYLVLIPAVGSVAWVFGYLAQDFKTTFYGWLAGLVLAMLICVPDWPIFNRNPTPWLEEIPSARKQTVVDDDDEDEAPASKAKAKKKKRGRAPDDAEAQSVLAGGPPAPGEHPQKPERRGIPQAPRTVAALTHAAAAEGGGGVGHLEADEHRRRHEGAAALAPVAVDDHARMSSRSMRCTSRAINSSEAWVLLGARLSRPGSVPGTRPRPRSAPEPGRIPAGELLFCAKCHEAEPVLVN